MLIIVGRLSYKIYLQINQIEPISSLHLRLQSTIKMGLQSVLCGGLQSVATVDYKVC